MNSTPVSQPDNVLNLESLQQLLTTRYLGRAPGWANELWESIDSTSNRACELAAQGAPHGVMVMARQQTAGRGRQGRTWVSPLDAGIYLSFLLRPELISEDLPLHTIAGGVACVKAIQESVGITLGLKWVNDLVANGKKVGGILAEIPSISYGIQSNSNRTPVVVIGIGINTQLQPNQVPDELASCIDCLNNLAGKPINANLLVASIAKNLEHELDQLVTGQLPSILADWRKYSVTLGHTVKAVTGNLQVEGIAVDIDDAGGLVLEQTDGKQVVLHAGEISIRNPDGSYT